MCVFYFYLKVYRLDFVQKQSAGLQKWSSTLFSIIVFMVLNLSVYDGYVGRDMVKKNAPMTSCINLNLSALFIGNGFTKLGDSVK